MTERKSRGGAKKSAVPKDVVQSAEQNAATREHERLEEARTHKLAWKKWGPYLSERQWGTVREDYSDSGNAWDYFTHDQSRSRAYRWGEDGLAGLSDDKQRLCFALALWNGKDPIIKERLFGLTNSEGNHGEDVKEYYFYLDSTPTHSYMKYLYKYPQAAYPYEALVETNRSRSRQEMEYELIDTGVFDQDRYFDVFVEYAKETPDDILIKISVSNRGPESAPVHVLPTLWFRNTWSWSNGAKPGIEQVAGAKGFTVALASHDELGKCYLACEGDVPLLFTENESNMQRLFNKSNASPYVKDGINDYLVNGQQAAVNPYRTGTKVSALYQLDVPGGETKVMRLRLSHAAPPDDAATAKSFPVRFEKVLSERATEADQFYASITPGKLSREEALVMRQSLAGMLWTKQYYYFDLDKWLEEHGVDPLIPAKASNLRNRHWFHMLNDDVISMPDKWEYPWYAAWDLAFHCVALTAVDADFAKKQLDLMLHDLYIHPNGQVPAYEWNFGDVNPPVHAWATWFVYQADKQINGQGDLQFLKNGFQKLVLNFTWWVNQKDPGGRNVFEGGFLGLDNIGVFDRSAPLPTGGSLEQADGTAWMALFSQNMLDIALELAAHDPVYEEMALKFLQHFLWIAAAMDRIGEHHDEMWDEADGFFYDLLRLPDGQATRLKVRSMVGLLPLCASTVFDMDVEEKFPDLLERARQFLRRHPELMATIAPPNKPGVKNRRILSILDETKLRRVLEKMLDEDEFLSPFGIRSLSQYHRDHPYVFTVHGEEYRVGYLPAESDSGMFGGNSNWRGPVWMPVNVLIIRALLNLYGYYGNEFTVECPVGSGKRMNLFEVAQELTRRLGRIFVRDQDGRRAVFGGIEKFQGDPHWRDCILFYEYFHGDNGAGLGASHQTGWTGLIGRLLQIHGAVNADDILEHGKLGTSRRVAGLAQGRKKAGTKT